MNEDDRSEVRETAQRVEAPRLPPMVAGKRGGRIYRGGVPGNRGGTGRPASAVRRAAREAFAERIGVLEEIADGETAISLRERCPSCGYESPDSVPVPLKTAATDKVKAMDLLARVALPQQRELVVSETKAKVLATARILQEELSADLYTRVAGRLAVVWGTAQEGGDEAE